MARTSFFLWVIFVQISLKEVESASAVIKIPPSLVTSFNDTMIFTVRLSQVRINFTKDYVFVKQNISLMYMVHDLQPFHSFVAKFFLNGATYGKPRMLMSGTKDGTKNADSPTKNVAPSDANTTRQHTDKEGSTVQAGSGDVQVDTTGATQPTAAPNTSVRFDFDLQKPSDVSQDNIVIGVSVGCGATLLIVVLVTVMLCMKKKKSQNSVEEIPMQPMNSIPVNPQQAAVRTAMEDVLLDDRTGIPLFAKVCMDFVEKNGLDTFGIYRLSGGTLPVNTLYSELLVNPGSPILQRSDVVDVSCCLKRYFRLFLQPLINNESCMRILGTSGAPNNEEQIHQIKMELDGVVDDHYICLKQLCAHLNRIGLHSDMNGMTPINLAKCFGPVIFSDIDPEVAVEWSSTIGKVIEKFIVDNAIIFDRPTIPNVSSA